MSEKLRPVGSENTQLLPQRVKSCSVSGFALLFEEPCPLSLQTAFSPLSLRLASLKSTLRSDILAAWLCQIPSKSNSVTEKRCWGDPRGCASLVAGGIIAYEKGRQLAFEASVGRGKAKLFPLQGELLRLNLQWSLLLFPKTFPLNMTICHHGIGNDSRRRGWKRIRLFFGSFFPVFGRSRSGWSGKGFWEFLPCGFLTPVYSSRHVHTLFSHYLAISTNLNYS